MRKRRVVHKSGGTCIIQYGRVFALFWEQVTCKHCLKHKPKGKK